MALVIFVIGAIFNRIRGGWLSDIFGRSIPYVKDINAIAFSLVFGYLSEFIMVVAYYAFTRLAFAQGWGGYIGAIIDRKIHHDRDDVTLLDKWFRSDDFPVLSGWAALSVRGLMLTTIISIPFISFHLFMTELATSVYYIPLLGLAMGTIYLLSCQVCELITFRGNGWQWGEVIFGGYLWATIYLLIS